VQPVQRDRQGRALRLGRAVGIQAERQRHTLGEDERAQPRPGRAAPGRWQPPGQRSDDDRQRRSRHDQLARPAAE
jgi:hypothetical protein